MSQDPKLSVAQRADKLAALDQKLSPAMREEREAPTRVIRTEEAVQQLRAKGATDDEVYRLRAAAFSPEGARALAELDRDEAAWKQRIARYLAERSALAPGAAAAVQQLRDKYFQPRRAAPPAWPTNRRRNKKTGGLRHPFFIAVLLLRSDYHDSFSVYLPLVAPVPPL
ncbi:hypothetical protein LP419_21300 [Massilia sp. H-1]|nr:hypothetical protein LP419_21300 [Massilia sp. H-1]